MIQLNKSAPSRKAYKKTNGFSHPPSLMQVLGIGLMVVTLILHGILIPEIFGIGQAILIIMCIAFYLCLLVIVVQYYRLTVSDPVDPRLLDPYFVEQTRNIELLFFCQKCKISVHRYSYHCNTCKRCVQEFDHHCKYTNNCVGKQNYSMFIRLLLFLILFMLLTFGQSLWVILQSNNYQKWIAVILLILSALLLFPLTYLILFHCYISFWKYGTTLKYLRGQANQQESIPTAAKESSHTQKRTPEWKGNIGRSGSQAYMQEPHVTDSALKKDYLY